MEVARENSDVLSKTSHTMTMMLMIFYASPCGSVVFATSYITCVCVCVCVIAPLSTVRSRQNRGSNSKIPDVVTSPRGSTHRSARRDPQPLPPPRHSFADPTTAYWIFRGFGSCGDENLRATMRADHPSLFLGDDDGTRRHCRSLASRVSTTSVAANAQIECSHNGAAQTSEIRHN